MTRPGVPATPIPTKAEPRRRTGAHRDKGADLPAGVETHALGPNGAVPNSRLPLLVMRAAIAPDPDDCAASFESAFRTNGWTGLWRNGIYPYDHYHSTAHEVLGVARGSGRVRFGGEGGPEIDLTAGDVVVVPAGTGHMLVAERDRLMVVGGYAGGLSWDIVRPNTKSRDAALERISRVPLPETDPVEGRGGKLTRLWQA